MLLVRFLRALNGNHTAGQVSALALLLLVGQSFGADERAPTVDPGTADAVDRAGFLRRLSWNRFADVGSGADLSSAFVYDVSQDGEGFIWLGTRNGLDRFDGYSISNYRHDPGSATSLSSNDIRTINPAVNGVVWVSSHAAGLDRFDSAHRTSINFRHMPGSSRDIGDDHVTDVAVDRIGGVWAGTRTAGLSYIDHDSLAVTRYSTTAPGALRIPGDNVHCILVDHDDRIWVGTDEGLVVARSPQSGFAPATWSDSDIDQPLLIQAVQQSSGGTFFLLTVEGQLLQARIGENDVLEAQSSEDRLPSLSPHELNALLIDSSDRLWVTGDKVFVYDATINVTKELSGTPGPVRSIFEDHSGSIWVSLDPGLYRLDPGALVYGDLVQEIKSRSEVPIEHVFGIVESDDGIVLLADPNGIWRIEPESRDVSRLVVKGDGSVNRNDTNTIYRDRDGIVWGGTYESGINRFDPVSGESETFDLCASAALDLLCNRVWALEGDEDGNLWAGSAEDLLYFDNESGRFRSVEIPDEAARDLIASGVRSLETGQNNVLWIGTQSGLVRWKRDASEWEYMIRDPESKQGLSSNYINALYEDDAGDLWIATQLGAHRLRSFDGTIRRFNSSNGLPNDDIHSIVEDANGTIWMSTGAGLVALDKSTYEVSVLDEGDGLSNDEFLLAAGHAGKSGTLYFGGVGSVVYFDPARIRPNRVAPQVVFTEIRVNNEIVNPDPADPAGILDTAIFLTPSITLPYDRTNFSIQFAGLHYANPARNHYRYKLNGYDEEWLYTDSGRRLATYTNIPPGDYALLVEAANRDGVWTTAPASLQITIPTPFWQTSWAYLLYGLILFSSIYLIIQVRTRALATQARILEQRVDERTRKIKEHETLIKNQAENLEQLLRSKSEMFANISHEFRTPLTLILGPVNRMLRSTASKDDASQLQLVKQNGHRLLRLVDQMLELSRLDAEVSISINPVPVSDVISTLVDSFRLLAKSRHMTFDSDIQDDLWINASTDAVERIALNLLSNAFKYTPRGGSVAINVSSTDDGEVILVVSDSGVGIPVSRQESVFERFSRANDTGENVPGAGIGLALVKELVDALQGRMELRSAPGEGTTVSVSFVRQQPDSARSASRGQLPLSETSTLELESLSRLGFVTKPQDDGDESDGPTVLVIEDNPDMRRYLLDLLSPNYACLSAEDGQVGAELCLEHVPDLVICDVMLPKMDGYQISQTLKSDDRTSHVPIIMLTALGDKDSRLLGLREGVDDYVAKPFDDEELLLRIRNILEAHRKLRDKLAKQIFDAGHSGSGFSKSEEAFLTKLNSVIEEHLSNHAFRLDALASAMAMSERALQRKLKALTGFTPAQYLRSCRLRKSLQYLRDGIAVGRVAELVGFSSPAYFSSCFRSEFGKSPVKFAEYLQTERHPRKKMQSI